jgi:hypothetical protein
MKNCTGESSTYATKARTRVGAGGRRQRAFRNLVRLLSVHETAEEMLVHPEVRQEADGRPVVEARLAEEHRAKVLLSTLGKMGPDAEGFDNLLVKLRDDVEAHAAHEEREEFPLLRKTHAPICPADGHR